MPNTPGAFLKACEVIKANEGNIVRVSYNEGINLFIEVMATDAQLDEIEKGLGVIAYVETPKEPDNMRIVVKINDVPGALYPVLEIFKKYRINITYLNSYTENKEYQHFSFGFNITNYEKVTRALIDISKLYLLDVSRYVGKDKQLDMVVKYIRGANNLQSMFSFQDWKAMEYIAECTATSKIYESLGMDPTELLDNVDQVMKFISFHGAMNFSTKITKTELTAESELYCIQPPAGSNIYIVKSGDKLLFVDTGMGIFSEEMIMEFRELFPAYYSMKKIIIPTHADVSHCGLIDDIENAKIYLTEGTYNYLSKLMKPMKIEGTNGDVCNDAFNRISRIITDYHQPARKKCKILKGNDGKETLGLIYSFKFGDLDFDIYEGCGGHIKGETVIVCPAKKLIFTGDILINEVDRSNFRKELEKLNITGQLDYHYDEKGLEEVRKEIKKIGAGLGEGVMLCYGHGAPEKM